MAAQDVTLLWVYIYSARTHVIKGILDDVRLYKRALSIGNTITYMKVVVSIILFDLNEAVHY